MINKIQPKQYIVYNRQKTKTLPENTTGNNAEKFLITNLNYSPLNINNKISFGIDDAGKRPVKGVKNLKIIDRDFSHEIASSRVFIERKESYPTSTLQDRMDDEAKGFEGHSVPIEFYPEDLEKLEKIEDIDEKLDYILYLKENHRFKYVNKGDEGSLDF